MHKLMHNELREMARGVRDGAVPRDEFFRAMACLFAHHFENLGVSDDGFRCWCGCDAAWSAAISRELNAPGMFEQLERARSWIRELRNRSHAFREKEADPKVGAEGSLRPTFAHVMQKHYFEPREAERAREQERVRMERYTGLSNEFTKGIVPTSHGVAGIEDIIGKTAEPGATDNPDDAQ